MVQKSEIRTRFPPSPTGMLHIGNARTAIFSWLFAKHHKGKFFLRLDDTDTARSTPEAIAVVFKSLRWLGIDYDAEPVYQTQRSARYAAIAEQLLADGKAYRCYCSVERLEALRVAQLEKKEKPRYDRWCLHNKAPLSAQKGPYTIRFLSPTENAVAFHDMVRGDIVIENSELDDLVLMRSNGVPTYNFASSIDDWDMGITHVIRGEDHISNTPRQINLLKALQAEIPCYAHLPMIMGSDGKKLSKRHGALSVMEYAEQGYFPEALCNYLVRLGWSHGDQEIFSQEELVRYFDLSHITRSSAIFNTEKLLWFNQHYMKYLPLSVTTKRLRAYLEEKGLPESQMTCDLEYIAQIQMERFKTIPALVEDSLYFFRSVVEYNPQAAKKHLTETALAGLRLALEKMKTLPTWSVEHLHQVIIEVTNTLQLNLGRLAQPLRVAVTGNTSSPSIDKTLFALGRESSLQRISKAIKWIEVGGRALGGAC
eukprot:TRINITY_DN16325_c0_g1_i1.p1 TRINITY_DN16325_c0_g1~~TRINITY_DN16325_c0_g1_i1.p1  ORF type:complete len:482 (+),score=-103.70 TRINITY_DN16325_c0_g1_i1:55-1500(+)